MSLEGAEAVMSDATEKSLPERLFEAYAQCSHPTYRIALKHSYDSVWSGIEEFHEGPTDANLIWLNGLWAHATRVLKGTPPEAGTPDPTSGDAEPARLAA